MGAITNSNGFYTTGKDDGKNHIKRHNYENGNEQTFRKYDDENIGQVLELSKTTIEDDTRNLAYKKAYELGMKTESEWAIANAKRSSKRQDADYSEYVAKTASSLVNQLKKASSAKTDDNSKSNKFIQQLNAIKSNGGLAIYGSLYYLSNAEDYEAILEEKGEDALKLYREFERDTLKTFYESPKYRAFHGETEIRAEIHTAEGGSQHLQTSDLMGEVNSRNTFRISPIAIKERKLKQWYRDNYGEDAGEMRYYADIHLEAVTKNENQEKRGAESAKFEIKADRDFFEESDQRASDFMFDEYAFSGMSFDKSPLKGDLVNRLFRRHENYALELIAYDKAKEYGVEWSREYGRSDGVYRSKEAYQAKRKELGLDKAYTRKDEALVQSYQDKEKELEATYKRKEKELVQSYQDKEKELETSYSDKEDELDSVLQFVAKERQEDKDAYDSKEKKLNERIAAEQAAVRLRESELDDRKSKLDAKEKNIAIREANATTKEDENKAESARLSTRETLVTAREKLMTKVVVRVAMFMPESIRKPFMEKVYGKFVDDPLLDHYKLKAYEAKHIIENDLDF